MRRIPNFKDYLETIEIVPQINGGSALNIDGENVVTLASALIKYISDKGIKFKKNEMPEIAFLPKSDLDKDKHPFFRRTGSYDPFQNKIIIFTEGRALKDILRSLTHEIIHADQYLNLGWDLMPAVSGLGEGTNPEAEKIEGDAYRRGNLIFREFEDNMKSFR